ncbi:hypothetical protein R3P38DRAFT_2760466 [Favolaschia claudopus]|uniref:Uncharacterized protein n=1 Tax=Favolaschia claudopus TaxID=2862362 RepID=A0AAW0DU85_9AGAR
MTGDISTNREDLHWPSQTDNVSKWVPEVEQWYLTDAGGKGHCIMYWSSSGFPPLVPHSQRFSGVETCAEEDKEYDKQKNASALVVEPAIVLHSGHGYGGRERDRFGVLVLPPLPNAAFGRGGGARADENEEEEEVEPEEPEFHFTNKDTLDAVDLLQKITRNRPDLEGALSLNALLPSFRSSMILDSEAAKVQTTLDSFLK